MSLPLQIRQEAETDLEQGRDWYEEKKPGLGDEFLECVEKALERIHDMPELYAPGYRGVRRCKVRRFPYVIYFRLSADRIEVIAIIHASRNPGIWKSRAASS